MRRSVLPAAVVAATLALTIAACTPAGAKPTASPSPSRSASARPSSTPTPTASPLPSDVIFQISATATAPDGTAVALTETVHAPVAATDHQKGDESQLDGECDGWRQAFPSTQFVVADVTATLPSGANWTDADGQIAVDMAGYPVWQGDQKPFQELCATAIVGIPGTARAVSPVAAGKPDSTGGWGVYRYGFSTAAATGGDATTSTLAFSRCRIQLGAAAKPSIFASTWPDTPETDNGTACRFGGQD
ncbi:hypothetical protein [Pseudolysinimonas sp.]|uniref:hypothetical protein n=1 Tax=Pseudolysinimonas sp. TaxID=2680009 RepID=UPI003F7FC657